MSTTKQSTGLFPKAVLASIGAAAATLDWTRTFIARAIERGEMEAKEASQVPESRQPAPVSSTAQARRSESMPAADPPAAASRRFPWVASRSDLSELQRQLDLLDEQVTALELQRANSPSGAASEAS